MPTYGYRCGECQLEFEVVERMADPPGGRCPACGTSGTRLFFPAPVVFKGTGFYKTDSRGSSRAPAPAAAGADGAAKPAQNQKPEKAAAAASTTSPAPPGDAGAGNGSKQAGPAPAAAD